MPNINSATLSQYTDLVDRVFEKKIESYPMVLKNSTIVQKMNKKLGTWDSVRFAEEIDMDLYAKYRAEGNQSTTAVTQYGYEKDATVEYFTKEIEITRKMRDAGKDNIVSKLIDLLTDAPFRKLELDLAHRLSFAWSTSYTDNGGLSVDVSVWDTLALISTVHTLTGSATTYSNQVTGNPQFSKGALELAERLFAEETYNNLGERVAMMPDTIITTNDPTTVNQVKELLNATSDINTSNSGTFNVYKGSGYNHIIVPLISTTATGALDSTKRKYWFVASSMDSDFQLCILNEAYVNSPAVGKSGEDFSSENWKWLSGISYAMAILTGRWIKGSKADGS